MGATDGTPILRADALDDELDEERDYATGGIVAAGDGTDSIPAVLSPCEQVFESYENAEGGWSYRRVW